MALRLTCPNCGSRPHTEFWFGGEVEARAEGPKPESSGTSRAGVLEADFARVWLRRNNCGVQHERWFHHAGCRRWHTARRDTTVDRLVD